MKRFLKNRFSRISLILAITGIGYYFLLRHDNISHGAALSDAFASFFWLLFFSFILQRIHSFYHSRSAISIVHLSIITVFSLLITLLTQWYGNAMDKNDINYQLLLQQTFFIRWFVLFLILLTIVNQLWIDKHLQDQEISLKRLIEKERQLAKSEMNSLQQQFQPHFLFNSLNSIGALVKSQPDKSREMLFNLSDFLRLTIQKGKEEFNTIQDEMNYLNLYLSIEKVRFGERLNVETSLDEKCRNGRIPSLLLQPLVENAVKYGLNSQTGEIAIQITITCQTGFLFISVENPYDKHAVSSGKGTGFGIKSIDRKLKFIYKQYDLLKIQQTDDQFKVTLKIPQHEEESIAH